MPDAPVLGSTTSETVALHDAVFGAPFNGPLVHEVVVAELAARRQGTHATKTRGKVSGGASKPWRQKGTGRARAGSSRSPIWVGGGTAFGPSPRHYTVKVNRKVRRAALRSALSMHAERESVAILDPGIFTEPSTKQALSVLEGRKGGKVLVVLGEDELLAAKSFRNLPAVQVVAEPDAGVVDVIGAATLVASRAAVDGLVARAVKLERTRGEAGGEAAGRDRAES
jgi:large subunit ribosomal protein L4